MSIHRFTGRLSNPHGATSYEHKPAAETLGAVAWQCNGGPSRKIKTEADAAFIAAAPETAAERDRLKAECHDRVHRLEDVTNQAFALRKQRDALLAACKALIGIDNPRADKPNHIDYAKAVQMGRAAIASCDSGNSNSLLRS